MQVDDPYQEYCHCYVRLGQDKCVLIDTGCGTHDLRGYIDKHINMYGDHSSLPASLPAMHPAADFCQNIDTYTRMTHDIPR